MQKAVLLIQDHVSGARCVQEALLGSADEPLRIECVGRCSEGLKRLKRHGKRNNGIAAVLVDLFLPDSQGIDTFDRLFKAAPDTPILVLSAPQDEETAKLAVRRGAQDYLLKNRVDSYILPKLLRSMIERAANVEALFRERDRAQVTLDSIGDAVISTDTHGHVTYINAIAERIIGWSRKEATGRPITEVFPVITADARQAPQDPMRQAIRENRIVSLSPNAILVRRDGFEAGIEDSAAPIHDREGQVTGAVMVFRDVTAARALTLKMSHLAQHDSLTDLPNRTFLNDRLNQAMAMAHRHGKKLALLYLDIDRFKHINDTAGHTTGDRLLQSIAKRLLGCVRGSDTVSRQGGDEFIVLLTEVANAQDAAVAAEKMQTALSAPHRIDQLELHVSASIGIVIYPDDGTIVESLLKNADVAMYRAKDSGRNNYQFFKAEMNLHALERHSLETDLRHALERREFVLLYQPKVDLRTGAITGVEALLRWRHPSGRLVRPSRFISIAEESGLIVPIGEWILREGCRQAKTWQDAGLGSLGIAINISPMQLRAKNFVTGVREILAETGLDARYLEFEITETVFMHDPVSTGKVIEALKDMGIRIALDDFGTGYFSLSDLKRFPIDTLKIDHSFVRDLATDSDDASIVNAVVQMGKSLKMRVVAEGVETHAQFASLRGQHCPEAQGFYFSEPVPPEAVAGLIAEPVGLLNVVSR
jgi:diguanylate cyclase (GGDEF)-like protein/PAS domain S-box-containing protein